MDCAPGSGTCTAVEEGKFYKYGVEEFGLVNGTDAMMQELQRGPIACTVAVTDGFENYEGGVFRDTTGDTSMDHSISVIGYGTDEEGTDYWLGRNSWGEYWGESGYFKIVRGVNNLGIEVRRRDEVGNASVCSVALLTQLSLVARRRRTANGPSPPSRTTSPGSLPRRPL